MLMLLPAVTAIVLGLLLLLLLVLLLSCRWIFSRIIDMVAVVA
jgi:hypothetical protein